MDAKLILSETRALYEKIVARYVESRYEENRPLSPIWSGPNMAVMRDILKSSEDAVEAVVRLQGFWFQQIPPRSVTELAVDWHLKSLQKANINIFDFPELFQESRYAPPDSVTYRNGRGFRPDFFRHFNTALLVKKFCGPFENRFSVFELGGGTGNLARLIKAAIPTSLYVIVDLPETICFSYMFLRLNFPQATILFLLEESELARDSLEDCDFVFAPVYLADSFLNMEFDVFVNTASMGEMRNETIRYWMKFIQEDLEPTYLLTVNRYLNTVIPGPHDWRTRENLCSVLYDARWDILSWELEPPYMRCPWANKHARYLQIVARRQSCVSEEQCCRQSQRLLEEAMIGSWRDEPVAMTDQENPLASDMSMDGILFRIWESIRLHPTKTNVKLMIDYLDSLLRLENREFEEIFFYEDLLEDLHRQTPEDDSVKIATWLFERRARRNSLAKNAAERGRRRGLIKRFFGVEGNRSN